MLLTLLGLACTGASVKLDTGDSGTADSGDSAGDSGDSGGDTGVGLRSGEVRVCLSVSDAPTDLRFPVTVEGSVVALVDSSVTEGTSWCPDAGARRTAVIVDDDAREWALGWVLHDPDGADVTPPFPLTLGETISATLAEACGEGCTHAFAIRRDGQLQTAAVEGYWGSPLTAADTPGLSVSRGAALAEAEEDCGRVAYDTIIFAADTTTELTPYATATVAAGGADLTVWAAAATHYVREDCTDLGNLLAWAASR